MEELVLCRFDRDPTLLAQRILDLNHDREVQPQACNRLMLGCLFSLNNIWA